MTFKAVIPDDDGESVLVDHIYLSDEYFYTDRTLTVGTKSLGVKVYHVRSYFLTVPRGYPENPTSRMCRYDYQTNTRGARIRP
jgi:hypothetical protein